MNYAGCLAVGNVFVSKYPMFVLRFRFAGFAVDTKLHAEVVVTATFLSYVLHR